MVGDGSAAESQVWIDAFRAIAGCDLDEPMFGGTFDLVEGTIDGTDDAGRVDGLVVAASFVVANAQDNDATITRASDVLTSMLAER